MQTNAIKVIIVAEAIINIVLSLIDLLEGTIESIHHLEVATSDRIVQFAALLMEGSQFTVGTHLFDLITGIKEEFTLFYGKVEVEVAIATHVVDIQTLFEELKN